MSESNKTTETGPRYPDVTVQLSGADGNAFMVMGLVSKALRRAGVGADEISKFRDECMSGDYDNLLTTCFRWVTVD